MNKKLLLSLFTFLAVGACKKDSLGTKPVITFKSYSSSVAFANYNLDVTFDVADGDGDIENTFSVAGIYDLAPTDTIWTAKNMPDLDAHNGTKVNAEVVLHLSSIDFIRNDDNKPTDSVHFLVFIEDNAGTFSDTIATPKIEIQYDN